MFWLKNVVVRSWEVGLRFDDGEFIGLVGSGRHWIFDPFGRVRIDVVSRRAPQLVHEKLDLIAASGVLKGEAVVVDLKDDERGLVWIDGRFAQVLPPGLYAYWLGCRQVRVEVVRTADARFEHPDMKRSLRTLGASGMFDVLSVGRGCVGVLFLNGTYMETLPAGEYAFWRGASEARVVEVDLREQTLDIAGQDIMTADKVTLRLNAVLVYSIVDARRAVLATADDVKGALYREAQLALRAAVGARELDALLADKDSLGREFAEALTGRAADLGLQIRSAGVRDIILPGDMKELMNKVTEARKAAEANLVMRREETAALRSQVNSAKLLGDNPVLMRLRELEVLEKIAGSGKLNVVLGETKLAEKVLNLL